MEDKFLMSLTFGSSHPLDSKHERSFPTANSMLCKLPGRQERRRFFGGYSYLFVLHTTSMNLEYTTEHRRHMKQHPSELASLAWNNAVLIFYSGRNHCSCGEGGCRSRNRVQVALMIRFDRSLD